MNLYEIDFNKKVIINKINLTGINKKRLYDLGILPGEYITKEYTSIFKDPVCYKVKNRFIAIRNKDASSIEVSYE